MAQNVIKPIVTINLCVLKREKLFLKTLETPEKEDATATTKLKQKKLFG